MIAAPGVVMKDSYDVLVVGGGIIGASAGHHLASAGYDTLLVEQGDYASGTSSRTSRMQNCGFMYFMDAQDSLLRFLMRPRALLASLELARRTMRERAAMVQTSPDRMRKVDFLIPLLPRRGITASRLRMGAAFLQASGGRGVSLEAGFLGPQDAAMNPLLGLMGPASQGAFRFAEYQYDWPERIVMDTILKGREAGLEACNHTRLIGLSRDSSGWTATLEQCGQQMTVRAKAVVNAAGAWVDDITRLALPLAARLNAGAKGVNLLVRLPDAARGLGLETLTARGTPFYVMPWGDFHYLGPADSPADAATTEFRATEAEISRIVEDANQILPGAGLTLDSVIYSWAGVRPRTAARGEELGSMAVCEHDLTGRGLTAFITFTGGLIMTHRDAGRRLLSAVQRHIRPSRSSRPVDYLLARHADEDCVTGSSIRRAILEEQARSLSDILRRRLSVGWGPDLGLGVADQASRKAAPWFGWTEAERQAQVAAYRAEVTHLFRPGLLVRPDQPLSEAASL